MTAPQHRPNYWNEVASAMNSQIRRRTFLRLGAVAVGAALLPRNAYGFPDGGPAERSLAFYNTHTGERLKTVYWVQGNYIGEALSAINRILRDHIANETKEIDSTLLDL